MAMELRHLRYFIAVVEEGSLSTAAEFRLHTSQPSLSRQIRDLEYQVGAELLSRRQQGQHVADSQAVPLEARGTADAPAVRCVLLIL
jgi:LysR family hca operon transcriptional activator